MRDAIESTIACLLAGLIWLSLGLSKAASPEDFIQYVYALWDGVPRAVPLSLIVAETVLGCTLVASALLRSAALRIHVRRVSVIASGVGCIASLVAVVFSPTSMCGCFGVMSAASQGRRLVVIGSLFFLGGVALPRRDSDSISSI